jgi:hypothetical protein
MIAVMGNLDAYRFGGLEDSVGLGGLHRLSINRQRYQFRLGHCSLSSSDQSTAAVCGSDSLCAADALRIPGT